MRGSCGGASYTNRLILWLLLWKLLVIAEIFSAIFTKLFCRLRNFQMRIFMGQKYFTTFYQISQAVD